MEFHYLIVKLLLILYSLRMRGVAGILGGAVKCVDIQENAGGESERLVHNLTLMHES